MKRTLFAVALVLSGVAPLSAQTPWIHVAVDETGEDASKVNVNLPLSVVRIALDAAPNDLISDGELHLHAVDRDIRVESLRDMWRELRAAGDAEFVTVEEDDETVRIRREGDVVYIDVDERGTDDPETVRIEVPVRVVDALFAGDGETLDLDRALAELSGERGNIVTVDGGDTQVRVWIDEKD